MKLKILTADGKPASEVELPEQFSEAVREDLIKKAFLSIQSSKRQPYGAFVDAGDQHTTWVSKRRRDWRGSYGHGISRVPRKVLSHRGTQFFWVGAQAPGTVGGRRAHPPKTEKNWAWKLNVKEKRKAIRSAMAATVNKGLVAKRGHLVPDSYPFIIDDSIESVAKTSELEKVLVALGFDRELARAGVSKVRAGKGKLRGRTTKQKKSVLFVVAKTDKLALAAKNLPGVDVVNVRKLNVESLAPGSHFGRATLYSSSAIAELKKGLFTKSYAGARQEKKAAAPKKEETPAAKNTPVKKKAAKKKAAAPTAKKSE